MLLALQNAFHELLKAEFPEVFGGETAVVALEFPAHVWIFDPSSAEATAGEPAQDEAQDQLPFDPAGPEGPYSLSRMPYPGPRRVYLRTPAGDRLVLGPAEVHWSAIDSREFTLHPKPTRALAGFDIVEVLYGVTAVFTKLKSLHEMQVSLSADGSATAERAELLALAAFALGREAVMKAGAFAESGGGYEALGEIKSLKLRRGSAPSQGIRTLTLDAEVELKVSRALGEDEGRPITRILSPGKAPGERKVDVGIDVQA